MMLSPEQGGRQGVLRGGCRCPLDYQERRVMDMSTYETLMVVIAFVNCLLIVLIAYISGMKK